MAWPESLLGTEVDLYLGAWTDVSAYLYQRDPIQMTRGRPDQSSTLTPASANATFNNRDNHFSINNPVGAYYGLLTYNTPARVSVPVSLLPAPYDTAYLRMEDDTVSWASCPLASWLELSGSLDVRADIDLSGYGGWAIVNQWGQSWALLLTAAGQLQLEYTPNGTTTVTATSSAQTPLPLGRLVVRATLDVTTGNVTFYTGAPGTIASGPWTQLGAVQSGTGATTLHPATAGVQVGPLAGAVYDVEVRNGINGTVVVTPAFNAQSAGVTSWTDAAGNVWSTFGTASISDRCYRFHGELTTLQTGTDPSATDVVSSATISGITRRLQKAQSPLNSPLYRSYVRNAAALDVVAYWPCEDGSNATQIATPIPGASAMSITGTPQLSSNSDFVCSAALPVLGGGTFTGAVPGGATWTANATSFLISVPTAGDTAGAVIAQIFTTGTAARMDIVYNSDGTVTLNCYNAAGSNIATTGELSLVTPAITFAGFPGYPAMIMMNLSVSGGTVTATLQGTIVGTKAINNVAGTFSGSIGAVSRVVVNPAGALTQTAIGHVVVQSAVIPLNSSVEDLRQALIAWNGETAASRIQRLCKEEGINCRIYGHPSLSPAMGYQTIQTLPSLLQECETTDRGMLYEPRTCVGIGYRTCASLYSQSPTATAVYSSGQLDPAFQSTTDDLIPVNDVTVSNVDGSSARQVLSTGPMSIQAPPAGVSPVDTQIQVNLEADGALASLANWILHVSTDAHDRVPTLPFNLARSETPRSIPLLRDGDLLTITQPPPWVQYDDIDQLAVGFTETLGPMGVWQINLNTVPAYPYTIAQVSGAGGDAVHVDTDGSQLAAGVSSTATSLSVTTNAGYPLWTTTASDFPFDVAIAGERLTVTNITGTASPQTFTVTRSVNGVVKAQSAGASVSLWYPPTIGL